MFWYSHFYCHSKCEWAIRYGNLLVNVELKDKSYIEWINIYLLYVSTVRILYSYYLYAITWTDSSIFIYFYNFIIIVLIAIPLVLFQVKHHHLLDTVCIWLYNKIKWQAFIIMYIKRFYSFINPLMESGFFFIHFISYRTHSMWYKHISAHRDVQNIIRSTGKKYLRINL